MIYTIEYLDLLMKEHTQYETDNIQIATVILHGVAESTSTELLGFSPELDGALDHVLYGVKLYDVPMVA